MILTVGEVFLRGVPLALQAGLRSGELKLFGSVIRDVGTGQIRGFLQETGALNGVVGKLAMASPGGLVRAAVDAAGHAVTAYQNEQIKAAVAAVHTLGVANLALSAVGIGVSVASHVVLAQKIERVERKVDALGDRLDRIARGVEALRLEPIRRDFTGLRLVTRQLDEGWRLADPAPEWRATARKAHGLAEAFARRAGELFGEGPPDPETVEPFLEALALAIATRVSARLAAGDDLVAREAAAEGTATLAGFGERLRPAETVLARLGVANAGTVDWANALEAARDAMKPIADGIRDREAAAESTVLNLGELDRRRIAGRAWLEAARAETEQPLLCLLPAQAEG